jgi:pentatricopeptide repeat protein
VQARGGDADAALATMREGIEATNNTVLLFRLATLLEEAEDFDAAARIYDRMLRQDLYPDAAANNLAMLLVTHRADDPQRLARAAELAERLEKSERPSFLDTAGWVQFKNGNYDRAVALLEQASDIGEPGPELRYHLGMAYLKQGRVDEAKQQLALAVAGPQRFPGLEEARAALEDL